MGRLGEILNDVYPYILQVLLGTVAVGGLLIDWKDYGERFGRFKHFRWVLLLATIAIFGLTLYDTHAARQETRKKELHAQVARFTLPCSRTDTPAARLRRDRSNR